MVKFISSKDKKTGSNSLIENKKPVHTIFYDMNRFIIGLSHTELDSASHDTLNQVQGDSTPSQTF